MTSGEVALGILSSLRYSFETVLRNRKRSLFAAIGIALALALVSGSLVAVDSSAYGLLRSAINQVEVDILASPSDYYGYSGSSSQVDLARIDQATTAIEGVQNVEEVSPMAILEGWQNSTFDEKRGNSYNYYGNSLNLAFLPSNASRLLKSLHITGGMPSAGTLAVPQLVSDVLGLDIGDNFTMTLIKHGGYYNYSNGSSPIWVANYTYFNLTLPISAIWTQKRTSGESWWTSDADERSVWLGDRWGSMPIVLSLSSYSGLINKTMEDTAHQNGYPPRVYYNIWIDREAVIDLADVEGSVQDLEFIQHRISMVGNNYGFTAEASPLLYQIQDIYPNLQMQKLLFTALSLPVVALGVYLSVVGIDLGVTSRRREVGMLKSRGASNRQVFGGLLLEALILGALAALIGLAMGLLVSRFLVGVAADMSTIEGAEAYVTDFRISGSTIELAIIFGVVLMLLSSYGPFKRVSKTDVAEALHQYSHATASVKYKARADILFLCLSGISIFSILFGYDWVNNQDWSWITRLIFALLLVVGIAIFPLMPFLLSLGVIRLMTRGSRKLYSKLTVLVKPWTGELHELVNRNIVRNPKRASNLAVIIALALAFGLFISVTMESTIAYQKETVKVTVGSDVRLEGSIRGPRPPSDSLEAINGVASATTFGRVTVFESFPNGVYYGWGGPGALLDAEEYAEVVNPSDFYFIDSGKDMLRELALLPDSVIVTKDFADANYLLAGDSIYVRLEEEQTIMPIDGDWNSSQQKMWEGSLTVLGIVKGLPGLENYPFFLNQETITWIPQVNLTQIATTAGAFIDAKSGANVASIVASSLELATRWNWSANAQTLQEQLGQLETDVAYGTLKSYLYTEYAMAIAIMSVGVGLIIFVAVNDRQQELACIMARGASGGQMRKILMGESMSLMALGLIVGASVGLLTSYLFNTLTQPGYETLVPHRMVFTSITWIIIGISIASLLVASLLATSSAGRIKLAEVLRIRGG